MADSATPLPSAVETQQQQLCDVLVIGGGPAGSTIATLLHERGWQVCLLDKDQHPRFHIGESLLPMNLPILERLGVSEQIKAIGVVKYGAEFGGAQEYPGQRHTIYFRNAMDKNHPYAYQVRRAEFDHVLLQNCISRGVEVRQGMRVQEVVFRSGQRSLVRASDGQQTRHWEPRFVVDASGRDTFLAGQLKLKQKNPKHQSAALFGHFRQVQQRPAQDAGNIGIYWFEHGWFWMIPLRDGVTSVGAVCWPEYLKTRRTDLATFLQQTIALCPEVAARMQQAVPCDTIRTTGNFSYRARRMGGEGYLLVGDAFAFIDPVFSSGVYLAMNSACLGAETVDHCLRDPARAPILIKQFERRIRRGLQTVSWFIYRFTSPAMRQLFMHPRNTLRIEEAIISLLAGDVFRKTPIGFPLTVFKGIYWLVSARLAALSWHAYRRRKYNAQVSHGDSEQSQDVV